MITIEDCIAMCGLSEEEVLAIAEHEHIPEIAAAALAQYLLCQDHGAERIREMLREDIRAALARSDRKHARELGFGSWRRSSAKSSSSSGSSSVRS